MSMVTGCCEHMYSYIDIFSAVICQRGHMCSYIYHFRARSHVNMCICVSMCMYVLKQNLSELHYIGMGIHVCTWMFLITVTFISIGTYVTYVI